MNIQASPSALRAFVIGPIGDKDAEDGSLARLAYEEGIQVFEEVIGPACIAFGVEAVRADMISRSGEIPEQIFRQLRDCAVVIADLTGANPNVMYELGLRHTTGRVLAQLEAAQTLDFLKAPPGNHLEALKGDRKGQHSIRINDQWRICFVWTDVGPNDVEIVDYH